MIREGALDEHAEEAAEHHIRANAAARSCWRGSFPTLPRLFSDAAGCLLPLAPSRATRAGQTEADDRVLMIQSRKGSSSVTDNNATRDESHNKAHYRTEDCTEQEAPPAGGQTSDDIPSASCV